MTNEDKTTQATKIVPCPASFRRPENDAGWRARWSGSGTKGGCHHDYPNLSVVQSDFEEMELAAAVEMPLLRLGIETRQPSVSKEER